MLLKKCSFIIFYLITQFMYSYVGSPKYSKYNQDSYSKIKEFAELNVSNKVFTLRKEVNDTSFYHMGEKPRPVLKDKDTLIRSLVLLVEAPNVKTEYASIISNNLKALDLIRTKGDNYFLPFVYHNLYYTHYMNADYDNAKEYLKQSIEFSTSHKLDDYTFKAYNMLGSIYQYNNQYDLAIEEYKKCLDLSVPEIKKVLTKVDISALYINSSYSENSTVKNGLILARNYIEEVKAYQNQLKTEDITKDHYVAFVFNYMNQSFVEEGLDKKLMALENAEVFANKLLTLGSTTSKASVYGQFARVYYENKNYKRAMEMAMTLVDFGKKHGINYSISRGYLVLARSSFKLEKYTDVLKYLDTVSASNVYKFHKKDIDTLYIQSYLKTNNYEKAAKYSVRYIKEQDSINKKKIENAYIDFGKKYQTEQKIQENELLKKDNAIKDLEVQQQKTQRNYLILFSVLGIIALGATYSRYRYKRKSAYRYKQQNIIINQQKLELEKSNANKQKLFSIIAHDLVNPFNAILGYTKLLEEDYESFNEDERKKFISIINKYANSNYNLTRALLDWAKIQQDKLVVNKSILNCKSVVENAIQPYLVLADKKNITITTNIPEDTFVEADQNMMQTVIGNLFVNAIKFTPQNGAIKFHLEKHADGTINIEIEDNGIGMTQEQLNNIFDITRVNTTQGTNQEKGNGLGLIVCKELMELQQGTLQLFSQKGQGSKAVLTI